MHAGIIFVICLAVVVVACLVLVFLNADREEREQVAREDRIHQAQAHLHTFRPRVGDEARSLAAAARVQRVSEDVERVAPRVGSRQAKGWNKR